MKQIPDDADTLRPPKVHAAHDEPINFRGSGWRASIPSAAVIALVTTLGSASASRCTSGYEDLERAQRQNFDALARRLDAIELSQRGIVDRVERESTNAQNRNAIQDIKIETLKREH